MACVSQATVFVCVCVFVGVCVCANGAFHIQSSNGGLR